MNTDHKLEFYVPSLLTPRESEVLRLLTRGCTYEDVASELSISINTTRSHVRRIYGKLGVTTKTEAVVKGLSGTVILWPDPH